MRQYQEHRSPVATTTAVAFVTYLIDWRGGERYRRFLASARKGDAEAVRRTYGRPIAGLDQAWSRRIEATAQAGGGKAMAAIKGTMGFYRPYALSLIGVLVTIFLALSFDLFIPQALKFLIDNVLGRRPVAVHGTRAVIAGRADPAGPEDVLRSSRCSAR